MKIKKMLGFILISLCFTWIVYGNTKSYLDKWEYMTPQSAEKRWGHKVFSAEAFKSATPQERATMSSDLITKKIFIGKTAEYVRSQLGATSGYFWSDHIPTYFIEEGWSQKKDSWQLVFLLDKNDRVTEVKIHKNCCYKN